MQRCKNDYSPSNLRSRVRMPSTPSTLFHSQILYYVCHCVQKRTRIKRGRVWPILKKTIILLSMQVHSVCLSVLALFPLSTSPFAIFDSVSHSSPFLFRSPPYLPFFLPSIVEKIKEIPRRNLFDYMSIGEVGCSVVRAHLIQTFYNAKSQKTNNGNENGLEKNSQLLEDRKIPLKYCLFTDLFN